MVGYQEAQLLMQLLNSMEKAGEMLGAASENRDLDKIKRAKLEILKLQKEVGRVLK